MSKANKVNIKNMTELPYAMEEAMNRLRINIGFLGNDIKKILVVSTLPNEGKSFIALHLWEQMVKSGTSAIYLDADLRKSIVVEKYGMEVEGKGQIEGTSQYLAGTKPIQEVILHTDIEGGDILPNLENVINPSMLLESKRFSDMLDYMEQNYRYTFIDCPPLNLVSDGERIGSMCDGAVLVVRGGETSKNMVRSSIQMLERSGCKLLGIVLNRVKGSKGGYYYKRYGGYYGGHYGYGYGYGEKYYYYSDKKDN